MIELRAMIIMYNIREEGKFIVHSRGIVHVIIEPTHYIANILNNVRLSLSSWSIDINHAQLSTKVKKMIKSECLSKIIYKLIY